MVKVERREEENTVEEVGAKVLRILLLLDLHPRQYLNNLPMWKKLVPFWNGWNDVGRLVLEYITNNNFVI